MNVGEATIARPQPVRLRVQLKGLAAFALLAVLWGAFVSWFFLAMQGESFVEALAAAGTIGTVLALYSMATVCWVAYNAMLYLVRGPAKPTEAPMPVFDKDHFGRPVVVAAGADFESQHLVLEFRDGQKVYRRPVEDDEQQAEAARDLMSLAAAAGRGVSPESATGDPAVPADQKLTTGDQATDESTIPSS